MLRSPNSPLPWFAILGDDGLQSLVRSVYLGHPHHHVPSSACTLSGRILESATLHKITSNLKK
jgi:hypothetical protein